VVFNREYQKRARRQGRLWTDRVYGRFHKPPVRKRDRRKLSEQLELFPADRTVPARIDHG
jgi:hypothetical protein